jgi:hypothetical protein
MYVAAHLPLDKIGGAALGVDGRFGGEPGVRRPDTRAP